MKHQSTIKEIAQELGVSISTVSRALQDDPRIGLRTKMRVQEIAQRLHYIPNPAAKLLRANRTFSIGVLLPYLTEEFFSLAITGVEDIMSAKGYNVIISQSREMPDREQNAVRGFINSRVDGVIASVSAGTTNYNHFDELKHFGIPLVFFDRVPKNFPAHQVRCNVVEGCREAVGYLIGELGISNIALLNGPDTLQISQERLVGYRSAMIASGLIFPPEYIKSCNLTRAETWQKMEELCALPNPPQAIVAFNDYVATYAMQWCRQHGKIPNKDIVFVSFANLSFTSYMDNPPLASIDQFAYEMGEKSAELLLDVMEMPSSSEELIYREIVIDTKLVVHFRNT